MDEARVGQKGRPCHRWWVRGRRPPGRCDRRYEWAYIFAAVEPATGADVALVLPEATTAAMNLFLATFAAGLPADVHAALVLDGAGWHGSRGLVVPANVTLVPLPPYSPESNPVERVWLYLRERFLSLRAFADHRAIVDACCDAWPEFAVGGERAGIAAQTQALARRPRSACAYRLRGAGRLS
jgi:hypothetical protein